ncbi:MAG: twin-arginine translocation signal domain-containing protein [Actinomycetota bacterium]
MDRRAFLKTMAVGGAGLAVSGFRFAESPRRTAPLRTASLSGASTATSAPCLFGAFVNPFGGDTTAAVAAFETTIGRPLAITRHYMTWNLSLTGTTVTKSVAAGHVPYIAWHATKKGNVAVPWSSIAAGSEDAWILAQADALRDAGFPVYLAFHHEPEDDGANGTPSDFAAAYDHVRTIFDSEGVTNATWVVTLMATTYGGGHHGYEAWLPPRFDLLGVDGYNRHPCIANLPKHPWKSFEEIFADARDAAVASGIPLFVGENGCVEQYDCANTLGDPTAKAQWFADECATLKSWPEVEAVLYSHTTCRHNGYPMEYRVDSSAASLAAYIAFGQDPYFLASV